MKKAFTKLLILSALYCTSVNILNASPVYSITSNEVHNSIRQLNKPTLKFSTEEDMLIGQIIFNNDFNFIDGKISDESIELVANMGKIELRNLKPNTKYSNIQITLKDESNKLFTFSLDDFYTPNSNFIGYSNVEFSSGYAKIVLPEAINNTIINISISDSSLKVKNNNNNFIIENITDGKIYSNITLTLTDKSNNSYTSILNTFQKPLTSNNKLNVNVLYENEKYFGSIRIPQGIEIKKVEISDKSLNVKIKDSSIIISKLEKKKNYENLYITLTDNQNKKHTFYLNKFSTNNKNFSYTDIELFRNGSSIYGKVFLPDNITISGAKFSDSALKFSIMDNNLIILNLSEDTLYDNLKLIVQDNNNKLHNFIINDFSTFFINVDMDMLSSYVKNAYIKAFNRNEIDEDGFNFWLNQLSSFNLTSREFIFNILNSDEFIKTTTSPIDKITRIYGVMFRRSPDEGGLKFWTSKYMEDFQKTNDEKTSVLNIVKEFTNSKEFQKIISDIGIKY